MHDFFDPNFSGEVDSCGENVSPKITMLSEEAEVNETMEKLKTIIEDTFKMEKQNLEDSSNPWLVNFSKTNQWRRIFNKNFDKVVMPNIPVLKLEEEYIIKSQSKADQSEDESEQEKRITEFNNSLDKDNEIIDEEESVVYIRAKKVQRLYCTGKTKEVIGSMKPHIKLDIFQQQSKLKEIESRYLTDLNKLVMERIKLKNSIRRSREEEQKKLLEFNSRKAKCSTVFADTLSSRVQDAVKDLLQQQKFRMVWRKLEELSQQRDSHGRIYEQRLRAVSEVAFHPESSTIDAFFDKFDELCEGLNIASDINFRTAKLKDALRRNKKHEIISIIENAERNDFSLERLKDQLRGSELKYRNDRALRGVLNEDFKYNRFHSYRDNQQKRKFDGDQIEEIAGLNNVKQLIQCPKCKRMGHGEDRCWLLHPEFKKEFLKNKKPWSKNKIFKIGDNAQQLGEVRK